MAGLDYTLMIYFLEYELLSDSLTSFVNNLVIFTLYFQIKFEWSECPECCVRNFESQVKNLNEIQHY